MTDVKHSPEVWTVDGKVIRSYDDDGFPVDLFDRLAATDKDMRLAAAAPRLLAALDSLFEHCAMIHKHWGTDSNSRQADAAKSGARALLDSLK